ncbi:YdcF family protein [Pandoraea nosoerga]|uniref:YdcF family protein n=1 Tax=Pandoraea nosoerga TaxID=2508296 RepID=A0A5E4XHT8_9BURK|nr:YdcF family protein [Pandoraea nosoerga]VVE35981.1 YdcF family protein [Pandoraea nosoerga]
MPIDWLIRNLIVSVFLPPVNVLVLAGLALVCGQRWARVGKTLALLAALGLWLQASPWFARQISRPLEVGTRVDIRALEAARGLPATSGASGGLHSPGSPGSPGSPDSPGTSSTPAAPAAATATAKLPQAVVILGGGMSVGSPEFGRGGGDGRDTGYDLSDITLARLRYGLFLARHAALPVLVSGGSPSGKPVEARSMARVAAEEFGTPVRWTEGQSLNTAQNAIFSARMLANVGVTRIYLVTSAWHMRRARDQFERAGLTVVPAPCCNAAALDPEAIPGWWPTIDGLRDTRRAMREWMALAVGH